MRGFHTAQSVVAVSWKWGVFGRIATAFLVAMVALLAVPSFAKAPQNPDPSTVKAQVVKFGVGKEVKVKLVGGEKLRGHIESIAADSFTVKLDKPVVAREVPYNQVMEVKDPKPIFWMAVGAAIVIVIIVIVR
jgi:hypothetical protein